MREYPPLAVRDRGCQLIGSGGADGDATAAVRQASGVTRGTPVLGERPHNAVALHTGGILHGDAKRCPDIDGSRKCEGALRNGLDSRRAGGKGEGTPIRVRSRCDELHGNGRVRADLDFATVSRQGSGCEAGVRNREAAVNGYAP
ncbi:hypothetical protein SDC9_98597 [bioreactor metagenome]|uniref:Uncharacterized protein n=1 Tax=bioreactor metagenome TaxID=1076179 RepID=A0A645AFW5_9ZZZZ